VLNITDKE